MATDAVATLPVLLTAVMSSCDPAHPDGILTQMSVTAGSDVLDFVYGSRTSFISMATLSEPS
jgi:hypothetical protein